MKNIFNALKVIIGIIAFLLFIAGLVLTVLGAYEMAMAFVTAGSAHEEHLARMIGIGLLSAVDMFLIAIVFFVLALGITLLFSDPAKGFPVNLPQWLRVKNFMELKVILWEAILTTLVIAFLTGLAGRKINGEDANLQTLIIPGGIFLVALSLYFLKKGKHE
jgi:uncharacterized membrane protein YqhA